MTEIAKPEQAAVNDSATSAGADTRLTQPRSLDVLGYTYFVRRADGLIKIGFSGRPDRRVKSLAREFAGLVTLAVVPASVAGEFETHQRFASQRVEGEWFRSSPELLSFIAAIKAPTNPTASVQPVPAAIQTIPRFKIKVPRTIEQAITLRNWLDRIQHKTPRPAKNFVSNLIYQIKGAATQADLDRLQPFMAYQAERLASVGIGPQ